MFPHRRRILGIAALIPAALFTIPDVASALGAGPWLPHAVIVLVTLVGFGVLLGLVLPGVDPRRGVLALFVAAWGALVLANAAGEAAGAVAYDHVVRGSEWYVQGSQADSSSGGNVASTGVAVDAGPTLSAGVLPSGTAAGPLTGGWIVGLAAVWVYRRTRPRDGASG